MRSHDRQGVVSRHTCLEAYCFDTYWGSLPRVRDQRELAEISVPKFFLPPENRSPASSSFCPTSSSKVAFTLLREDSRQPSGVGYSSHVRLPGRKEKDEKRRGDLRSSVSAGSGDHPQPPPSSSRWRWAFALCDRSGRRRSAEARFH